MSKFDREDYYRLLQTARRRGQERLYLLMKLVVCTGLSLRDLQTLTVEEVESGTVEVSRAWESRAVPNPDCLRWEVQRCARRSGQKTGLLFTRRDGQPMGVAFISNSVRRLSATPENPGGCCTIRDLQNLYYEALAQVGEQGVCDLIEQEQEIVGWNPTRRESA